jgi:hypothetical protein
MVFPSYNHRTLLPAFKQQHRNVDAVVVFAEKTADSSIGTTHGFPIHLCALPS